MFIAIVSIVALTSIVWLITKTTQIKICPICAGVTLTWLWLLIAAFLDKVVFADYKVTITILMGGTVVGLMSQFEKKIEIKFFLVWKTIFIIAGFIAVYSLTINLLWLSAIAVVVATIATILFKSSEMVISSVSNIEEIKGKMKSCC